MDVKCESLDWIRCMNSQLKSPGAYISTRLESVSLEQLQREFSSLLLTSQSHGSTLLSTAFSNATGHNDNLKKIIMSMWPLKDKVTSSYESLKCIRDKNTQILASVNSLLHRLTVVLYSKKALSKLILSKRLFHTLCTELLHTFKSLNVDNVGVSNTVDSVTNSVGVSNSVGVDECVVSVVVRMIELVSKNVYRLNSMIHNIEGYNLESSWLILQFAPKELDRVLQLVEEFKSYDGKLRELVPNYTISDDFESCLQYVIHHFSIADYVNLEAELCVKKLEEDVRSVRKSLVTLTELCSSVAFTRLYKLYTELNELNTIINSDGVDRVRIRAEINKFLSALTYTIRGFTLLNSDLTPLLHIFNDTFLIPFSNSFNTLTITTFNSVTNVNNVNSVTNVNSVDSVSSVNVVNSVSKVNSVNSVGSVEMLHEEAGTFSGFVDRVEKVIFTESVLMQFLDELSELIGDENFKSLCILRPVALWIFTIIEDSFSHIFSPIDPDYRVNYSSFERLLTIIECKSDSTLCNLFKWRASALPYSYSTRFCVNVITNNFLDNVISTVNSELHKYHELGNLQTYHIKPHTNSNSNTDTTQTEMCDGGVRSFFLTSSLVVYGQMIELFSVQMFNHMFGQHLKTFSDVVKLYLNHIESFIIHMEMNNNTDSSARSSVLDYHSGKSVTHSASGLDGGFLWPSGLSFAYSAYVLHDIIQILNSLTISDLTHCKFNNLSGERFNEFSGEKSNNLSGEKSNNLSGEKSNNLSGEKFNEFSGEKFNEFSGEVRFHGFGAVSILILKTCLIPLKLYINRKNIKDLSTLWDHTVRQGSPEFDCDKELYPDELCGEELGDKELCEVRRLLKFTVKGMLLLIEFINNINDHINFIKDKLDCEVSDYVKFLVAPLCSFHEFTREILSQEVVKDIMVKTVQLVSSDYISHIKALVSSVETLNSSLTNPKHISLSEYSESFLIVDIEMLKKQISRDIEEFYQTCKHKFNVQKSDCNSLELLLQFN
eukprot:XP_765816.1 hypothetical protein [Theileria parva strain Muguga]